MKWTADRLVSLNKDITSPQVLYNALSATNASVKLFFIDAGTVSKAMTDIATSLRAVPDTISLHQAVCTRIYELNVQDVSCFCSGNKLECDCFEIRHFSFRTRYSIR